MELEWLKMLACPVPKGLLAFVAAAVVGYVRWYADMSPSYDYRFFLWLLAVVAGGALLAYFPLVRFCAA